MGLSLLLHGEDWAGWLKYVQKQGRPAALMIGYMHLVFGTFILGFHWQWQGLPLLTTLVGVMAIGEGLIYTLFPNGMLRMLAWYEPRQRVLFRTIGIVTIVIGIAILGEWRQSMHQHCVWKPCFDQASVSK